MSTVISKTAVRAARGTQLRIRVTVKDQVTGAAKDLSGYAVTFGIKAAADETAVYTVSPIAGTTDNAGHLDAVVPASSMATVAPGDYVGEFNTTLAGESAIRVQLPVQIVARVITA